LIFVSQRYHANEKEDQTATKGMVGVDKKDKWVMIKQRKNGMTKAWCAKTEDETVRLVGRHVYR
jgi:hypothetical protein